MPSPKRRHNAFAASLVGAACVVCALGFASQIANRRSTASPANASPPAAAIAPSYVIHEDFDPFRGLHDEAAVASRSNAFSVALFRAARTPTENAFVVTTGVRSALSMMAVGARGDTRAELLRILALPDDDEAILRESGGELRSLQNEAEDATIRTPSRLFVDRRWPLSPAFSGATRRGWKSPAEAIDFRGDGDGARTHIEGTLAAHAGAWARGSLAEGLITPHTDALLVNAPSFAVSWVSPFASDQTRAQPFFTPRGSVTAEMMNNRQVARWSLRPRRTEVSLETYGGLSLRLLLPQPPDDLARLVAELAPQDCEEGASNKSGERVDITLPRLRFAATNDLVEPLRKLGLERVFSPSADLSGVFERAEGQGLSGVVQAAAFSLDESGIGPGATWSLQGVFGQPPWQVPARLRFDRPFVFLLCAWETRRIVAIGQVVDPSRGN